MHNKLLTTIFASRARVAILRVFLLDPRRAYYQRQLEAATGLAIRAVQRELERLTSIELLYRRTDGNRTYYRVDTGFPLFPELRGIVLKTSEPADYLRGVLALDDAVQQLFLCEEEGRALVVTSDGRRPRGDYPGPFALEVMSREKFAQTLAETPSTLEPFLSRGVDLLGRRDDVIWRRIESADFDVKKGKGVP